LDREFFEKKKRTLVYQPAAQGESGKINLFLPLCVDDGLPLNTLEQIIENSEINFGTAIDSKVDSRKQY